MTDQCHKFSGSDRKCHLSSGQTGDFPEGLPNGTHLQSSADGGVPAIGVPSCDVGRGRGSFTPEATVDCYSAITTPEPPRAVGKSRIFGRPSFIGRTVFA